jgi:hypothetical protein
MPNVNPTLVRTYVFLGTTAIRLDDYFGECWLVVSGTFASPGVALGNSALAAVSASATGQGIQTCAVLLDRLVGVWAACVTGDGSTITIIGKGPTTTSR